MWMMENTKVVSRKSQSLIILFIADTIIPCFGRGVPMLDYDVMRQSW